MDLMRRNPSTVGQMTGTESMNALFRNITSALGGRWEIFFFLARIQLVLIDF